jgi:hypothetical protein
MKSIIDFLMHPYPLLIIGIILWELEQVFTHGLHFRKRLGNIGRGMIWGGFIVAYDDEIVELIENKFDIIIIMEWYYYIAAGFFIDIARSKLAKDEPAE